MQLFFRNISLLDDLSQLGFMCNEFCNTHTFKYIFFCFCFVTLMEIKDTETFEATNSCTIQTHTPSKTQRTYTYIKMFLCLDYSAGIYRAFSFENLLRRETNNINKDQKKQNHTYSCQCPSILYFQNNQQNIRVTSLIISITSTYLSQTCTCTEISKTLVPPLVRVKSSFTTNYRFLW